MKKKLVTHSIGAMGPTGRDAVSTLASTPVTTSHNN
jgi:hypothetical protein